MHKIKYAALLLALLCTLSGCNNPETVTSSETEKSIVVSETVVSLTEASDATTTTATSETEKSTTRTTTAPKSETTTEASKTTAEVTSKTTASTEISSETQQTTASATEKTTCLTTGATTEKTTTEATTTEPEKPKPPPVIHAKKVSSPGEKTEESETAVIDYSNSDKGYISALYKGKSKRAKLRIVCGGVTTDHDLSVSGKAEYFPLMQGSGDYTIQIYEQLDGKVYSAVLDFSVPLSVTDEVEMYLYPNRYVMFTEKSECVKKSAQLCAGIDDDIQKIAEIFRYITDNVTYDYDLAATVKSGYIPDPDAVFEKNSGICFDYASLFAAMTRSQNIPTRLVIGYASPDIYHAWNEVYTKETGWITPELLLSEKGYNLVDATFYAGSENKKKIAEYISDDGNYSSVYLY